jgi:hypothetical protein
VYVKPITAELIAQQSYLLVTEEDFCRAAGGKGADDGGITRKRSVETCRILNGAA